MTATTTRTKPSLGQKHARNVNHCTALSKLLHHLSFLLLAGTWHQTKESPWNLMGDITCLAPQTSCLADSLSQLRSLNLGDGWLLRCRVDGGTGKARRSGSPSSSQVSHFWAQLFPAGCANGHSPLLQAPAHQFRLYWAFLVKPRHAQQKLNFSVMCSPWPHLFLFPTAGGSWRWAVILHGGEHHHNNKTPKQPMKLSPTQDTLPQMANSGHQSLSSEPGFAFLT